MSHDSKLHCACTPPFNPLWLPVAARVPLLLLSMLRCPLVGDIGSSEVWNLNGSWFSLEVLVVEARYPRDLSFLCYKLTPIKALRSTPTRGWLEW